MKEEAPICKDCGQPMFEVGDTGKTIQIIGEFPIGNNMIGNQVIGVRSAKLYQCPEDKTVAIQ